ncbi:MAG: ATP-binding protein, partial [Terriglobales bacterium]
AIVGASKVARDITQRKRVEDALQQSNARRKFALETAKLGDWELDLTTQQATRSLLHDQIFGYPSLLPEWSAEVFLRHIHPDDRERIRENFQVSTSQGKRLEFECRIVCANGEVRWIWACGDHCPSLGGDSRSMFGIVGDITARKQAEEQVEGQTEELSRQADELARSRKVLETNIEELARSNHDLEQFAYVASHDLQEPLRMVAAYTQLLGERYANKLDENADKYIHYAMEGAQRMQTLVQDLLTFSRVGRDRQRAPVACEEVVREALKNLQAALQESGAEVQHDGLPGVNGDRTQLLQLFQNLIGNAIKFRGDRAPLIAVGAEKIGNELVFCVSDNGIGIAAEHMDTIFVIFQRLHTRAEYPGNGVGLAICKKIVEQHGGRIWVESKAGEGTSFKFTLPASPADGEMDPTR